MSRTMLVAIIAVLVLGIGIFAYQAHERDKNTLGISVGSGGVKVN